MTGYPAKAPRQPSKRVQSGRVNPEATNGIEESRPSAGGPRLVTTRRRAHIPDLVHDSWVKSIRGRACEHFDGIGGPRCCSAVRPESPAATARDNPPFGRTAFPLAREATRRMPAPMAYSAWRHVDQTMKPVGRFPVKPVSRFPVHEIARWLGRLVFRWCGSAGFAWVVDWWWGARFGVVVGPRVVWLGVIFFPRGLGICRVVVVS
jgi:hypothetical protein